MDRLDKAFADLNKVIEEGGAEYNKALKEMDTALAKLVKSEGRKARALVKHNLTSWI